ncbi:MAG: carbamate kinase, partial [Bacteroidota bacterium]
TVITQELVERNEPAIEQQTKPIGPFYSREEALRRQEEFGWVMIEDAARGYRRVVPSPKPLDIVELDVIRTCVERGIITIAVGGGGIPVVCGNGDLHGVEAVVDKDRASALLAKLLQAEFLIISTGEEYVYLNYRKSNQRPVPRMTLEEALAYSRDGQFPPGNMGPKIESAVEFLQHGGREVIITTPEKIVDAIKGRTGTRIVP